MREVHVPLSLRIRYILRGENFHQERIDSGKMVQCQQKGPCLQESEGSLVDEGGPRDHHIANTVKICRLEVGESFPKHLCCHSKPTVNIGVA